MAFTTTDGDTSGASAMRVEQGRELLGLKAIYAYLGKSENTVRRLIREQGLPAAKIGGEWQSNERLIREWRIAILNAHINSIG